MYMLPATLPIILPLPFSLVVPSICPLFMMPLSPVARPVKYMQSLWKMADLSFTSATKNLRTGFCPTA